MDSPGGSILDCNMRTNTYLAGVFTISSIGLCFSTLFDPQAKLYLIGTIAVLCVSVCFSAIISKQSVQKEGYASHLKSFWLFCYSCFLKPHDGDTLGSQRDALESFYKTQAGVYDSTREALLKGREDMLALAAAQLLFKSKEVSKTSETKGRIWVDIGGGTGWNIEAMSRFIDVPQAFDAVYLVDFSPSLCEVARKRFDRLGWGNVKVICQDATKFRLEDYEQTARDVKGSCDADLSRDTEKRYHSGGADLVTMSYSLSMIPNYYSVIDSLSSLLAPQGILGVADFYVQSQVDVRLRNYTGGLLNRHVGFLGRVFWRAWFEIDRVALEPGRRDYLEYQFGTVLSVNNRNYTFGAIPFYIWLGSHKQPIPANLLRGTVEEVSELVSESPYSLTPKNLDAVSRVVGEADPEIHSKAFDAAMANLSSNLPLPSYFYQNKHWRIYYDDQLKKHTQFKDEYIYAFTWEDTRVDAQILDLGSDDVVLAITSAGDNTLSYALKSPAKIYAVDLNPAQNHLLELKMAALSSLEYQDFWSIFGEGKHAEFRSLLLSKMSPYLSSRAFQYWFKNHHVFTKSKGGLYDTGGSRHGIRIFRLLSHVLGCRSAVKELLATKTLDQQKEIWHNKIRPAFLSRMVSEFIVSRESFLWTALGVPKNQLAIIEADHAVSDAVCGLKPTSKDSRFHAILEYMIDTLDPMMETTHVATDNPYYLVCLDGHFTRQCHPDYLSPAAHARLSGLGSFENLEIHTDDLSEVIARITPGSLTVAVIMDSMDWFDPGSTAATAQINKLNLTLKMGGRIMLRSAGLKPWYIKEFEERGFRADCKGKRMNGACIDRVNMYASCWILTKIKVVVPTPEKSDDAETASLSL